jgi:hypothetical protein
MTPEITRHSTFGECLLALLVTEPDPVEALRMEAAARGKPISAWQAGRAVEMKRRQEAAGRVRKRPFKPLMRKAA